MLVVMEASKGGSMGAIPTERNVPESHGQCCKAFVQQEPELELKEWKA